MQCSFSIIINSLQILKRVLWNRQKRLISYAKYTCTLKMLNPVVFLALSALWFVKSTSLPKLYFSVLHFIIIISGSKSVKCAQKFRIFFKFLTVEGTLILVTCAFVFV